MILNFQSFGLKLQRAGIIDTVSGQIYTVLETEPKAYCILGKHSTNWAKFPVPENFFKATDLTKGNFPT